MNPFLTIFSVPKPFTDPHINLIQRNAIQSWLNIGEGVDILGEVWGGTINKYLSTFPGMDSQLDAKTITQWVLLGDPSLKIGGYL